MRGLSGGLWPPPHRSPPHTLADLAAGMPDIGFGVAGNRGAVAPGSRLQEEAGLRGEELLARALAASGAYCSQ